MVLQEVSSSATFPNGGISQNEIEQLSNWGGTDLNRSSFPQRMFLGTAIFAGAFLSSFAFSTIVIPTKDSSAVGATSSASTITLSLDKTDLALSDASSDTNGFVSEDVIASITCASKAGYNFYMSASGKDKDNAYTNSLVNTTNKNFTIDSLSTNVSLPYTITDNKKSYNTTTNFTTNKWGYNITDITNGYGGSGSGSSGSSGSGSSGSSGSTSGTATFKPIPLDEKVINYNPDTSTSDEDLPDESSSSNAYSTTSPSGTAADGTTPDLLETAIASRVDKSLPAGNYTNTIVFTAISKAVPHTVTVTLGDGVTGTATGTGDYFSGDTVTLGGISYNTTGYHGLKWSVVSGGVTIADSTSTTPSFTMLEEDVEIKVEGIANTYTIAYNGNTNTGGSTPSTQTITYNSTTPITIRTNTYTKTGYTFSKWSHSTSNDTYTYTSGQTNVLPNTFINNANVATTNNVTITLYAKWSINSHTVSVTKGSNVSGTATGTGSKNYGTTVTLGGISPSSGYHLSWSSSDVTLSNTTATNPTFTMPDKNVSVSVSGVANTYNLIYNKNDGSGTKTTTTITYGGPNATLTNSWTRSGYTFLGWSHSSSATSATYTNGQSVSPATLASGANVTNTNNGSINLYAIWVSAAANTITYNCNNATGGTAPSTVTNVANGASVTLTPPNCYKTNYGFAGWNTNASGTGTNYGPQETITAPNTMSTAGMVLYARWIASAGNMQSWTGCSSLSTGAVTARKDTRDNNVYAIAKLADGKCWVIENLRAYSGTISSATTNNPKSGLAWPATSNNLCLDASTACYNAPWLNTNNINTNLTASPTENNNSSSWYSYGVYYNWNLATGGNGLMNTSGDVASSICPAGWHLPTASTSGNTGEWQVLYTSLGSIAASFRKYPNNIVLSGGWTTTSAASRGEYGLYMSATGRGGLYFNNVAITESTAGFTAAWSKQLGRTVRCITG